MFVGALLLGAVATAGGVEEPLGYRMEQYRAPVPDSIEGGTVVDTAAAHALWTAGEAVFVDVLPRPPRPAGLPEDTIWRPRPRDTIPGTVWLPDVGYGAIAPETDAWFRDRLAEVAAPDDPVVIFCLADCWMSWNAARRAIREYGYADVFWYPGGTTRWIEAGYPVERVEPEPR